MNFWIQTILTIASILIGALLVIWQIGRQFRDSMQLNRQNRKNELYLEIYKDFETSIDMAIKSISNSMSTVIVLPNKFITQNLILDFMKKHHDKVRSIYTRLSLNVDVPLTRLHPIEERATQILDLNNQAQMNVIKLIRKLESYEIAFMDFSKIKQGITQQLEKYRELHSKFYYQIVPYLPMDVPETQKEKLGESVITPQSPSEDQIKILQEISNEYMEESMELTAYICDLQVALQNRLLGDLFDNKVQVREPNDPRFNVLHLDDTMS